MVQRWRILANDEIQSSDAATFKLNLPENGNLHALIVRVKLTNGATAGRNINPTTEVDGLRVVGNGDYRFFDVFPLAAQKWQEVMRGAPYDYRFNEAAGAVQEFEWAILFGRGIFDPEMFLPLSSVKNPRLEIPYSPNIAADGGFATGTFTVNVMGLWTPNKQGLSYRGTLCTRDVKAFTSLASGDDAADITIREPIRAIGIYAYENQVDDGTDITQVRIEANSGDYDLFKGDWEDLQEISQAGWGGKIQYEWQLLAQDNDVLDTHLSNIRFHDVAEQYSGVQAGDVSPHARFDTIAGDRLTLDAFKGDFTAGAESLAADTTDRVYKVVVEGQNPSYFGLIDYADVDDPSAYLDPTMYDKLRIILTQGGAGADVRETIQYLKQVSPQ